MIDYTSRDWELNRTAWFRRPADEFGGFSNMSVSYPLSVLGKQIRSSEHLYQAMRFTQEPEVQQEVLRAESPMESKQVSREWDALTRPDWMDIRVDVMRWVLRIKLAQHVSRFGSLLTSTGTRAIVEWSRHDSFWGAGPVDAETVHGANILGQLLTELRDQFANEKEGVAETVPAPKFSEPKILEIPVGIILPPHDKLLLSSERPDCMQSMDGTH